MNCIDNIDYKCYIYIFVIKVLQHIAFIYSKLTIIIIIMFIIYSKERKTAKHTHTQHGNKLLIYTITLIYKYTHSRKKT